MRIAFIGDLHGAVELMYRSVEKLKSIEDHIDVLFQIGDFQAIRDKKDLSHFPVPERHKSLGDYHLFHEIFNEEEKSS
mgnify:CR=1 FL=1